MSLHAYIPSPHEVSLSDEENEAYYIGAEYARSAAVNLLEENGFLDASRFLDATMGGVLNV